MSKNLDVLIFYFMKHSEKSWDTRMNRAKFFRAYPKTAGLVKLILTKDELTLNSVKMEMLPKKQFVLLKVIYLALTDMG